MKHRIWPFLAFVLALQAFGGIVDAGRIKRAAMTNCQTSPSDMDKDNVVDDGKLMSMSCDTDPNLVSCIWRHTDPITYEVRLWNDKIVKLEIKDLQR